MKAPLLVTVFRERTYSYIFIILAIILSSGSLHAFTNTDFM